MKIYEKELGVAKEIAKRAGAIMLQYFDGDQQMERKEDKSMVTVADKEINRLVIEELSKNFDDIIIGEEESTGEYGMGRRWFCDPIDGTKAFVWGVPTAMFSLSLVVDGVPVLGVAYDPFLDRLYEAVSGEGSYCNDVPIKVSNKEVSEGIVGVSSTLNKILKNSKGLENLKKDGAELAFFSGAVFKCCLVARGKLVGFFAEGVNAHDMAAVQVIIEESGGKVTDLSGSKLDYSKPFKGAIASNGVVHDKLAECIF